MKLCWLPTKLTGGCGWRGLKERRRREREVDLSTCGCVSALFMGDDLLRSLGGDFLLDYRLSFFFWERGFCERRGLGLSHQQHQRRTDLEWMVAFFNGGWVELGFHEERPHQVTPIWLPAERGCFAFGLLTAAPQRVDMNRPL